MGLNKRLFTSDSGVTNTENFAPVTYSGNSSTQSITGVGFQPDFVWIKSTDAYNSRLFDSVRGVQKYLASDSTTGEITSSTTLTSFNSNGFSLGNDNFVNRTNFDYVAWCWKGGGTAVSNTDGSITSSVSANTAAGFSIVKYTGNNGSSGTIGHGLSSPPELIITKNLGLSAGWPTMIKTSSTSLYGLRLNTTGANDTGNGTTFYNDTAPTSTVYTVGGSDETNDNYDYIAYCFHSVDSYQKIGTYSGGTLNQTITTGFQPRFVMIKITSASGYGWAMFDSERGVSGSNDKYLAANSGAAEADVGARIEFVSTGFQLTTTNANYNASGQTYLYWAIA